MSQVPPDLNGGLGGDPSQADANFLSTPGSDNPITGFVAPISDDQLGFDDSGNLDSAGLPMPSQDADFTGLDNIPVRDRILWKAYAAQQAANAQSDSVAQAMMARDLAASQDRYQKASDMIDQVRGQLSDQKYPVQGPTTPDAAESIAAGLGGLVSGRPDQANIAAMGLAGQRQGREYDAAVHQFGIDRQNTLSNLQDQEGLRNFAQQQQAAIQGRMESAQVNADAQNLAAYNHLLTLGLSHDQALQELAVRQGYSIQNMNQSLSNAIAEQNNQFKNQTTRDAVAHANALAMTHDQQKNIAMNTLNNAVLNAQSPEDVNAVVQSMQRLGYTPPQEAVDAWTAAANVRQQRYNDEQSLKKTSEESLSQYRQALSDKAGSMGDWYERRPGVTGGSSQAQLNNFLKKSAGLDAQIAQLNTQLAQPTNRSQRRALQAQIQKLQLQKTGLKAQMDAVGGQNGVMSGPIGPLQPGQAKDLGNGITVQRVN